MNTRRFKIWCTVLSTVLLVMFTFSLTPVAQAQPFELDGNATVSDFLGTDWDVVNGSVSDPGGDDGDDSIAKTGLVIDRPEPSEAQFTGGGSKDEQPISAWKWRTGNPNDKANITNAYAAAFVDNGDFILTFGMDRFDTSGDAQLGFWFLQDDVQPFQDGNVKAFSGDHLQGDLLVLVNFSKGGDVPTIEVFEWIGGPTGGPVSLGIGGAVLCAGGDIPAGQDFCGITNATNVSAPWTYENKDVGFTNQFPPGSFFEGAINLTQALGTTKCFTNFLAESRTSTSITATLKDFATPEDGFNVCSIAVNKACTSPRLNLAEDKIIYDITGTVMNNGFGTVYNVAVTDSPAFDSPPSFTGDPSSLAGGASIDYSATITVDLAQNGTDDEVTATANTESDGSGTNLTDKASVTCPSLQISPALSLTKECKSSVTATSGEVVAQVTASGEVCNIGDTRIDNVSVVDDQAGSLLSSVTLVAPDDPTDPGATLGACKEYEGTYTPDKSLDFDGAPTTDPGAVIFKDTATASGKDIFNKNVTQQKAMATCPLCPTCPDCP